MFDVQLTRSLLEADSWLSIELVESGDEQPATMIPSEEIAVNVMLERVFGVFIHFLIPKFIFLINQNMKNRHRFFSFSHVRCPQDGH